MSITYDIIDKNDDGFESEGMRLLKEIAHNFASQVWIVAPDTDRSGCARSLDYQTYYYLE